MTKPISKMAEATVSSMQSLPGATWTRSGIEFTGTTRLARTTFAFRRSPRTPRRCPCAEWRELATWPCCVLSTFEAKQILFWLAQEQTCGALRRLPLEPANEHCRTAGGFWHQEGFQAAAASADLLPRRSYFASSPAMAVRASAPIIQGIEVKLHQWQHPPVLRARDGRMYP